MQANKKIVMVTHSARPYANQVQCFSTVTVGRGSQSVGRDAHQAGRAGLGPQAGTRAARQSRLPQRQQLPMSVTAKL